MSKPRTAWKWALAAGTFYPILFILIFTVLGLAQPSYSVSFQPISDLELGPYGWVQNLNFIVLGLCFIAFAFGFHGCIRTFASGSWARSCRVFMTLCGTGYMMGGLFTYDPHIKGIHGILHGLGYLLMTVSLVIVLFLAGFGLLRLSTFRKTGIYSLVTGSFIIGISIVQFVPPVADVAEPVGGLLNRAFLIVALTWNVVVGNRLLVRS